MLVFWLIFTLVISPASPDSDSKPTDLKLITDNFLTLARITNAIYLQSAAIRKDIKARDVIVELLKIAPAEFHDMINIDVESAISTLGTIDENIKNFLKRSHESKDDIKRFKSEFLENMQLWHQNQKTPLNVNIRSDDLKNAIRELMKTPFIIDNNCSSKILAAIPNLKELIEKVEIEDKKITEQEAFEKLNDFKTDFPKFLNCFMSMSEYRKDIKSLPIWKNYMNYRVALNSVIFLLDYLRKLPDQISPFKNELDASESIWKNGPAPGTLNLISAQILKVWDAQKLHSNRLEPPLPVFTLSFLEPQELLKITKDIESPWFKKHFVRGASTKKLQKALKPFQEVSEKLQQLHKVWIPFNQLNISSANDAEINYVWGNLKFLEGFMKLQNTNKKYDELLDGTISALQDCSIKPDNDFDVTANKFTQQQNATTYVIKKLDELFLHVKYFKKKIIDLDKNGDRNSDLKDCLKVVNDEHLNKLKQDNAVKTMSEISKHFASCINIQDNDIDFFDVLEYFEKLKEEQDAFFNATAALESATPPPPNEIVTFQNIFEKSKVFKVFDCLRDRQFNPDDLLNVTNFIKYLHGFPKDVSFTISYLSHIPPVQTSLKEVENKIQEVGSRSKRSPTEDEQNPVLWLNDSRSHSENIGVCALALWNLVQVQENRKQLLEIKHYPNKLEKAMLKEGGLDEFVNARGPIKKLLIQTDELDMASKDLRKKDVLAMSEIFDKVSELRGVVGNREKLWKLNDKFKEDNKFPQERDQLNTLIHLNLDFAMYHSRLKDGRNTVNDLKKYFDRIFGHIKDERPQTLIVEKHHNSWLFIVLISIGIILLLAITGLIVYGCTPKGRKKFMILYIFYFGKPEDFEKRWRYSYFADKVDGKNALLDAVREISKTNLLVALKKGAYINAYNFYGNTALHAATKAAHPEFVKLLIKYGADRTLLNTQNRTPEQMIPFNYGEKEKEKAVKYDQIKQIFKKYRNKKFRIHVPVIFPVSSYHIFIEENTDNKITNQFLDTFPSITSIEPNLNSTHCIVPTDENGILVADNINLLFWIFNGTIIVKEKWMIDCIQNEMIIEQDFKYLVENVKFKGVVYDTIIQWTNSMAKYEIPYLHGVLVIVVMKEYFNLYALNVIVTAQGGALLTKFPKKKNLNIGACPYLHANLGPIFIIHDGLSDLTRYKNDKMYTLFTEDEFIIFLLERKINRDTSENPIFVTKPEDEIDRSEVEDGNE